ncbi:transcription initiation factor TFIID subunit 4 isoform X6 [Toxorhynchites rutilus septentrionalis]|uniref:transcription initiation factor TFIID subunit 4 isoform X6 n=1 Tax=Toxorhynchites rutilus septentrionalis TaxID=329112 RepID=UPI00247AA8EE|nr:transcription initiation factor TFIID subunit 4 isoform X6 [Toxorhynchites rutilus septentrionalis]
MASANFLEEALKSDVDESAVNAIVGTLENQLDQSSADQVQQVAKNFECGNSGNSLNSEIVSNGGATPIYSSVQQQQKHSNHGVTNGEIVSNVMNSNGNNNNNINSKTYFISSSVGQNVINSVGSGATTVVVGKNITASAAGIPPSSTPPALIKTVPTVSSSSGISIISNQIVVSAGGQPPPPFNVPTSNNNNNSQYQSNMPKNEPVKLVYPSPGGGTGTPNAGTQAVLNMNNNRVTLTSTSLPNGTISLTQTPQLIQTGGAGGKTTIQATGQPGNPGQHQGQTLIIKNQQTGAVMNTGAPGIVTMTKPINNQATQNIVGLPAGVQIVNVRPGAPPTQAQQKTVAAVSPRVVIGSQQIVSTRPPNANAITLSALQGQPGSTLLLKNEQGQFQLLRIGPAPAGAQITPANLTATSATNQTIRLQTVPAVSRFTGPPLALRKTIVTTQQVKQKQNQPISSGSGTIIVNSQSITNTPTSYVTTQSTPVASVAPVPALAAQQHITISTAQSPASAVATGQPTVVATQHPQTTVMTTQQPQQPQQLGSGGQQATQTVVVTTTTGQTAQQRNSLDNTKEKCRKFLTNLIELSKREPKPVEKNVRTLIQELVDANVEPEEFCERLERLLNASPQPCLIGFLKKSLPLLRQSLVTKEITIEGINPPSANVAFSGSPLTQIPAQIRPVTQTIVTQNSMVGQTQIRMLTTQSSGTTVPRIGQTTIRPAAPVRIQTPIQQHQTTTSVPRQITTQHIRPNATATVGHTTIVQTSQQLPQTISTTPPALLPHHVSSSMYGDDDINDVAAMGGVNLAEETQRILGSTEFVGTQIRSCKDEVFLHLPALQAKIRSIIARHGLEEPNSEVAVLISHACQERLKNVVEKLAVIAEHRIDIIKVDPRYEVTKDVRGQIKFLEELDKAEQKRHEEQEREMLMRAAKSRSKTEDPEQAKLKAKAKEMQRAEMEELRQRDANLTALQAIGPRKKPKLEEGATAPVTPGASGIGVVSGKASTSLRPRIKRVNLRDMLFYLEQEKESCRSQMLYKAYLK